MEEISKLKDNILIVKDEIFDSLEQLTQNEIKEILQSNITSLIQQFMTFSSILVQQCESTSSLKDDKITELTTQIKEQNKLFEDADLENVNLKKINDDLKKQNIKLSKDIEKIKEKHDEQTCDVECEKQCDEIRKSLNKIKKDYEILQKEYAAKSDCDTEITGLTKRNEQDIQKHIEQISKLISEIEKIELINTKLKNENDQLKKDNIDLLSNHQILKNQLKDIIDELEPLRHELDILKQNQTSSFESSSLADELAEVKQEKTLSDINVVGKNIECQQLKDVMLDYIKKNEQLEKDLSEMHTKLISFIETSKDILDN
jgi:hypothetical protein